ncbi:MAG: zinc metalloprotease HtpX [Armatimonadota bacterium]|nr:MAG: zinc metalloprotease HtpX [Armatimonadota bacterium]
MNTAKTALLMIVLTGLFIVIGYALGGESGMIIAFGLAFLMNIFSYWFSDKIVLAMYRAKEVDEATAPGLYAIVRRLTQRAGLPMPRVYLIPQAAPNAFATGRNPQHAAVAVTQGLLQALDDEALEGVIAHELSHVGNRDILIGTIAATLAGAIMILSRLAMFAGMFFGGGRDRRGGGIGVIFVAIFGTIAALLIQMAISRSREYQADASAAKLSGNPRGLARALQALQRASSRVPMQADPATSHMFIVNPFTRKGLVSLFSTHPPIEERVERLERMRLQS